MAVWVNSC